MTVASTSRVVIHLGCSSPNTSSGLPESGADHTCWIPIWPCSEWGLPCHPCYHGRGALLPHPFTLTVRACTGHACLRRFAFCGTFRRFAPPRHYLAPCPAEPGLSSRCVRFSAHNQRLPGRLGTSISHSSMRSVLNNTLLVISPPFAP